MYKLPYIRAVSDLLTIHVLAPWPPMGVLSMGLEHCHRGKILKCISHNFFFENSWSRLAPPPDGSESHPHNSVLEIRIPLHIYFCICFDRVNALSAICEIVSSIQSTKTFTVLSKVPSCYPLPMPTFIKILEMFRRTTLASVCSTQLGVWLS